jgi:hypothetical protein
MTPEEIPTAKAISESLREDLVKSFLAFVPAFRDRGEISAKKEGLCWSSYRALDVPFGPRAQLAVEISIPGSVCEDLDKFPSTFDVSALTRELCDDLRRKIPTEQPKDSPPGQSTTWRFSVVDSGEPSVPQGRRLYSIDFEEVHP